MTVGTQNQRLLPVRRGSVAPPDQPAQAAKWAEYVETAGIQPAPVPPKILLPILQYASIEEDNDLRGRWAALLARASNKDAPNKVHIAFTEILHQLSATDARFLDLFFDRAAASAQHQGIHEINPHSIQKVELSIDALADVYDQLPHDEPVKTCHLTYGDYEQYPNIPHHLSRQEVIVRNCMRLGLIDRFQKPEESRKLGHTPPPKTFTFLTALGYEFVEACRQPRPTDANGK